jgi:hypothetical protein
MAISPSKPPELDLRKSRTGRVATQKEVEAAINGLTEADLIKLSAIASYFCNDRSLSTGTLEPKELLGEAIFKTLTCTKKWRTSVSILRHLDRAMENISGHAKENSLRRAIPKNGEEEEISIEEIAKTPGNVVQTVQAREELRRLKVRFGSDHAAWQVVLLRACGATPQEISRQLRLSAREYETIAKRIRRLFFRLRETPSHDLH